MFDHADTNAEFRDVEQMVRAAGNYLVVTDDLRPRTVERARRESRKTSTHSWIAIVAALVVLLAMPAGMASPRLSSTPLLMAGVIADGDQLYATALQKAAQANVDPSWSLVDAFSELRERQASLIQDAF